PPPRRRPRPERPASGPMPGWSPPTPRAPIPEDPHPYLRRRPPRGNVTCYGTSARGGAAAAVVALARRALAQRPFRLALPRQAQALPHWSRVLPPPAPAPPPGVPPPAPAAP